MLSSLSPPSFWRPWASLDYVSVVWCWVHSSSEALLGCGIILGVAYVAVRGGVYQGTTFQAPLLKLGIGLGLICGLAGYVPPSSHKISAAVIHNPALLHGSFQGVLCCQRRPSLP